MLAASLAFRFGILAGLGLELAATLPLVGEERALAAAFLRLGWRFDAPASEEEEDQGEEDQEEEEEEEPEEELGEVLELPPREEETLPEPASRAPADEPDAAPEPSGADLDSPGPATPTLAS